MLPSVSALRASGKVASGPPRAFDDALRQANITLTPKQRELLCGYVALLTTSNRLLNLTAVREHGAVWSQLVLDALQLLPDYSDFADGTRVLDVGCGGGLPGVPLAIALPKISFTLLDATQKKVDFVSHVGRELSLDNLTAVCGRAEERSKVYSDTRPDGNLRESFDVVTARGLARLPTLLELTTPFVKPAKKKGTCNVIFVKGQQAEQELLEAEQALLSLRTEYLSTREYESGRVLRLSKHARTPANYPRANGIPKKKPL